MFGDRRAISYTGVHPCGDWRVSQTVCYVRVHALSKRPYYHGHVLRYGSCMNCDRDYNEIWDMESATVPRSLKAVVGESATTTWADQIDKESIERNPFYIHGARLSEYVDQDDKKVSLIVLDITINDPSRKAPRAVITLGLTDDRAPLLEAFPAGNDGSEPIGPCITYQVPLKGGQKFWRLEEAPNPDDVAESFAPEGGRRKR